MATLKKSIRRAFLRKDLKKTEKRLEEFASVFRSHILKENVRMYAYLQQQFTDEKINIEIVKYFRKEMNSIARTVLSFLEKYESLQQISEEQLNKFLIDLENISKVIHERMQREEEKLYPLYLQIASLAAGTKNTAAYAHHGAAGRDGAGQVGGHAQADGVQRGQARQLL